ncbi:MAG: phosphoserine transaminase [Candidatus Dormibacter sp.]|uniref:phosphoserine transaminase n=1 Tax=Candidatus Dormibacter sp. TaxID=2973982 RepID=UPI000DB3A0C7|nr:MAG: phosphoserine transaminase [Candidatus Dormibacteraeota bacterium]
MSTQLQPQIKIPPQLKPADGRFGCGPSKIRPQAMEQLQRQAATFLGTSHRQSGVRTVVGRVRSGLSELFQLPDGYEVLLGNGGSTCFWDCATFGLIERKSQHLSFGEFSAKFAAAAKAAPHLSEPEVIVSPPGTRPDAIARADVDVYALTHNETSTGVAMPIQRPVGAGGLVVVDGTSAAGGLRVDPRQFDVYYFAPQKCFASDGGLWLAACSPAAIERIEEIRRSGRWTPAFLDLGLALDNSRLEQTYNTPALATLFLLAEQVSWLNDNGGLEWAAGRCDESARILYGWAERTAWTQPFVMRQEDRSHVVATIDLAPGIDAARVSQILRQNGIVDTEAYRKLGRNQLRIALFPAIEPADVEALTGCIEYVAEQLRT